MVTGRAARGSPPRGPFPDPDCSGRVRPRHPPKQVADSRPVYLERNTPSLPSEEFTDRNPTSGVTAAKRIHPRHRRAIRFRCVWRRIPDAVGWSDPDGRNQQTGDARRADADGTRWNRIKSPGGATHGAKRTRRGTPGSGSRLRIRTDCVPRNAGKSRGTARGSTSRSTGSGETAATPQRSRSSRARWDSIVAMVRAVRTNEASRRSG